VGSKPFSVISGSWSVRSALFVATILHPDTRNFAVSKSQEFVSPKEKNTVGLIHGCVISVCFTKENDKLNYVNPMDNLKSF
jgi:hypothetical protein